MQPTDNIALCVLLNKSSMQYKQIEFKNIVL